MPWKTLCGFPPTTDNVSLAVPNGRWRPDTVITDIDGNEIFVILEQTNEMRSFEVIIGDLEGRKLVCVKRHLMKAFWRDGFYFCTYRPNYPGQKALKDRDVGNKKVYPFSYLEIQPLKGRFLYRHFDNQEKLKPPRMLSQNPWVGFMMVCCTPLMRFGNFTTKFHKPSARATVIDIDQWKNIVTVGPGNDLLAALCMAYVFDRVQNQPLITVVGREEDEELEEASIESKDDNKNRNVEVDVPEGTFCSYDGESRSGNMLPYRDDGPAEEGHIVPYRDTVDYSRVRSANNPDRDNVGDFDDCDPCNHPTIGGGTYCNDTPEQASPRDSQRYSHDEAVDPYGNDLVPAEIV